MAARSLKSPCLLLLLLLSCLEGCRPAGTLPVVTGTPGVTSTPWFLEVNGEGISWAEFESELVRYQAAQVELGNQISEADASQWVLDDLTNQLLLAQGAREAGFTIDESAFQARIDDLVGLIGGQDRLESWMAENGYSEELFRSSLSRAIAAAWMRDQIVSSIPSTAEQVHVRQILLYNLEEAQTVLAQLDAGEDFETLAANFDPITQGELGWFPRGYLTEPAIEAVVFSLQPGQFSEVVETTIGYHILFLIESDPAKLLSPDALLTLQTLTLEEWLTERREQSQIIIAP